VHGVHSPYRIEFARPEHAARLPAIEIEAAALFSEEDLPGALRQDTTPVVEGMDRSKRVAMRLALTDSA